MQVFIFCTADSAGRVPNYESLSIEKMQLLLPQPGVPKIAPPKTSAVIASLWLYHTAFPISLQEFWVICVPL